MGLVTLKMLDPGPNRNYAQGEVIQVDALRAAYLVEHNHAEEVKHGDSVRVQRRKGVQRRV